MNQDFSGIYQGIRTIQRRWTHSRQCLLHIVVALAMAIEESKIQPRAGTSVTGFDSGPVFSLRGGKIFLFFRDASTYPVRTSGIELGQWADLLYGFIASAADDP